MTLLDTIRLIESLAASQPSVHMIVRQDARRLNDCPDALYAAFAWVQGTHTRAAGSDTIVYSFSLFYIDRLTADRGNETGIQSNLYSAATCGIFLGGAKGKVIGR